MGDKIIEGEGEVIFADTGAKPDSLDVVVSPAPAETDVQEADDNASLMRNLLAQMWEYLNAKPNKSISNFGVMAAHYAPFLRFKSESESILIQARSLTREEYLSVLKQTTPELGAMLEGTNLKELLPASSLQVYDIESYNPVLASLKLGKEAGCEALADLVKCTRKFTYIPDLKTFSLFLANGKQLREFLRIVGTPTKAPTTPLTGVFKVERFVGEEPTLQTNFPETNQLFAPELVLKYVQQTGTTNVREMLVEYDRVGTEIINKIRQGNDVTTSIANARNYLYQLLEKNNPSLVLK